MSLEQSSPDNPTDDIFVETSQLQEAIAYLRAVIESPSKIEIERPLKRYVKMIEIVKPHIHKYRDYLLRLHSLPFNDFIREFMSDKHIEAIVVVFGCLEFQDQAKYNHIIQTQSETMAKSLQDGSMTFLQTLLQMSPVFLHDLSISIDGEEPMRSK